MEKSFWTYILIPLILLGSCSSNNEEDEKVIYSGKYGILEPIKRVILPEIYIEEFPFNILESEITIIGEEEIFIGNETDTDYIIILIIEKTGNVTLSVSWEVKQNLYYQKADIQRWLFKENDYGYSLFVTADGIYYQGNRLLELNNFMWTYRALKGDIYNKLKLNKTSIIATGIVSPNTTTFILSEKEYLYQCKIISNTEIEVKQLEPVELSSWTIKQKTVVNNLF